MVVQTQVAPDPTPITVNDNKIKNINTDKNTTGGGPYVKIRLLIQSRVGGAIIGKGGKNIMGLRQDFQAKISVPDSPGPERVITIAANEDNAMEIIAKILPYIEEGRGRAGGDHEVRVLVHQSRSGAVIGKGGNTIKELRAETGARIKLFTESCPVSTDRVMLVHGNQETIVQTLKRVNNILKDVEIRGPYEPYDPYNYDPPSAYSYGGFPEGEGRTAGYTRGQGESYGRGYSGWYGGSDGRQYGGYRGGMYGRNYGYAGRGVGYRGEASGDYARGRGEGYNGERYGSRAARSTSYGSRGNYGGYTGARYGSNGVGNGYNERYGYERKGSGYENKGNGYEGRGSGYEGRGSGYEGRGSGYEGRGSGYEGRVSSYDGRANGYGGRGGGYSARSNTSYETYGRNNGYNAGYEGYGRSNGYDSRSNGYESRSNGYAGRTNGYGDNNARYGARGYSTGGYTGYRTFTRGAR